MRSTKRGISIAKLQLYKERQGAPAFGADYEPAIKAVRGEAPPLSRAYRLYVKRFQREIHLLSENELISALVALYIPTLLDLHEQKVIHPVPDYHPLCNFPKVINVALPHLSGTVAIAERLGYLDIHPTVTSTSKASPDRKVVLPFPYVGDLLLYLQDEHGGLPLN